MKQFKSQLFRTSPYYRSKETKAKEVKVSDLSKDTVGGRAKIGTMAPAP